MFGRNPACPERHRLPFLAVELPNAKFGSWRQLNAELGSWLPLFAVDCRFGSGGEGWGGHLAVPLRINENSTQFRKFIKKIRKFRQV